MLTGCALLPASSADAAPVTGEQPAVMLAAPTSAPTTGGPTAKSSSVPPAVPDAVEQVARSFVTAYASRDARDGQDDGFTAAGRRAARWATGDLVRLLGEPRAGQAGAWARLREDRTRQTAEIVSVVVPDGAPDPTPSAALVRVGYRVTATTGTGRTRTSADHMALRLTSTSDGWRVAALPWA
ncbi:hypothetical protein ACN20G_11755 [Streptomyces sp. BI20]|uniref:hypothetical protein n=1 Tax=Streptomyces sp. BI20 TaxID=3403460 RepID=UPI003C70EE48